MPIQVVNGAMMMCTCGAAPSTLIVLPVNRTMVGGVPAANIMDHIPVVNIPPFGMCASPANPTVASATSAALGVLTPMPCAAGGPGPLDTGFADRHDRQHAGPEQYVHVHVHLGGHHLDHHAGSDTNPDPLRCLGEAVVHEPWAHPRRTKMGKDIPGALFPLPTRWGGGQGGGAGCPCGLASPPFPPLRRAERGVFSKVDLRVQFGRAPGPPGEGGQGPKVPRSPRGAVGPPHSSPPRGLGDFTEPRAPRPDRMAA